MPPRCNIIGRPPNCVPAITSPKSTWPIHILNCGIMPPPQNMLKAPPLWIPDRCKPGRCWEMRRWKTVFLTRHWTLLPKRRKSILPIPGYTIIFRRLTRKIALERSARKRLAGCGKSGGDEAHHINFGYLLYEASLEKADSLCGGYARKWLEKYPENPVVRHMGKALSDGRSAPVAPPGYVRDILMFSPPILSRFCIVWNIVRRI